MKGAADAEVGFEEIYARAGDGLEAIPWATLAAHPGLVAWLDRRGDAGGQAALVIGCGLGDDAEALNARGYRVRAFDIAPTAIARCHQRFPDSSVDYRVADLFALRADWRAAFDLVVEIRTLQSLPVDRRARAAQAIADTLRGGGRVWLCCLARDDGEPVGARPWPVSRSDLRAFTDAGLRELEFVEQPPSVGRSRSFTVVYGRD